MYVFFILYFSGDAAKQLDNHNDGLKKKFYVIQHYGCTSMLLFLWLLNREIDRVR